MKPGSLLWFLCLFRLARAVLKNSLCFYIQDTAGIYPPSIFIASTHFSSDDAHFFPVLYWCSPSWSPLHHACSSQSNFFHKSDHITNSLSVTHQWLPITLQIESKLFNMASKATIMNVSGFTLYHCPPCPLIFSEIGLFFCSRNTSGSCWTQGLCLCCLFFPKYCSAGSLDDTSSPTVNVAFSYCLCLTSLSKVLPGPIPGLFFNTALPLFDF